MPGAEGVGVAKCHGLLPLSMPEKREQDNDRDRDPERPKKNAATHGRPSHQNNWLNGATGSNSCVSLDCQLIDFQPPADKPSGADLVAGTWLPLSFNSNLASMAAPNRWL